MKNEFGRNTWGRKGVVITQAALDRGGVEIENTGSEPLVLTFDFPQNAHSKTPGV
ncbi:MAG: hypothetical protein L7W40_06055 [Akkermansiaceae bacterium]|nr:hypothetical protein [Akkermansiaceae bacterium]